MISGRCAPDKVKQDVQEMRIIQSPLGEVIGSLNLMKKLKFQPLHTQYTDAYSLVLTEHKGILLPAFEFCRVPFLNSKKFIEISKLARFDGY